MLVAAMNPSPSGGFFENYKNMDLYNSVQKYLARIKSTSLDRIDLQIEVDTVPIEQFDKFNNPSYEEKSQTIGIEL